MPLVTAALHSIPEAALHSWPMAKRQKGCWVVEAGEFSSPTVVRGGSGSGRCVSARTREGSKQPLPLQPAFACGKWLAGGGEWPSLAELLAAAAAAIGPFVSANGQSRLLGHLPKANSPRHLLTGNSP